MKYIYLILLLFATATCSSDPAKKQFKVFAKRVPKGTVNGSIMCKGDMQQSYALYLPSGYNPETKYPVIICFDPHGDGTLPVNLLKDEAEKLGLVLVGSNTVRNGLLQDAIFPLINTTLNEVRVNINIDETRIYFLGFSGGARVALSAMFQFSSIRGVIACSGSIPASYVPKQMYIAGIGGSEDMNYSEMLEMENGFPAELDRHILFTFQGVHSWPPKAILRNALQWLSIGEMKDKIVPVNKEIIEQFIRSQYNDSLSVVEKYSGLQQIVRTVNGLTDVSVFRQKLETIKADPNFQKEVERIAQFDSLEKAKQEIYRKALNDKPIEWWIAEVNRLRKAPKAADIKLETAVNKRLLAFISLSAYSITNYSKNAGDMQGMARYLDIYGLADPENPDYYYFLAHYYAHTGKKEQTFKALEKAFQFGFADIQKIRGDAAISALIDMEALQELVNRTKLK